MIADQARTIEGLEARIVEQDAEIAELKRRLAMDSTNSSKPPGSDSPFRKPPPRSQRRASGRKPGAQPGHEGTNLQRVADPDEIVEHRPATCEGCGITLAPDAAASGFGWGQVFDLPQPRLLVTEHRMLKVPCACGAVTQAPAPEGVSAPAQYGPGITALAVYAQVQQHLPSARTITLAADAFAATLSEGFVNAAVERAAIRLAPFAQRITALLQQAPIAHFDESGIRVATSLHWVHVACTTALTWYTAHPKRGKQAMDAAGVLPHFTGTAVTDAFTSYQTYDALTPALCNAHLLRDLDGVHAADPAGQVWAKAAADALTDALAACHQARDNGQPALPAEVTATFEKRFDQAVKAGRSANPDPPPGQKKPFARQLADRMTRRRDDFLRFLHDLTVPFTNNQAEQDIRMIKIQAKTSGGWRTLTGANRWLLLRSYLSTARKHDLNPLTTLRDLFNGNPWLPPAHT
ncbi:IS66 family transposase [Streptomyces sp. JJ66]|uniref:IS66 family transposase n=1 Tax=Streptomyces sp. JJ66 TaxID=2803843 RepID=UPI001C58437B|nr:IS66 family transposase [Streptomyces sp. JJ66]MBW1604756.1 IS66 family transposase [Streptomyces sp. JJ66]